MQRTREHATDTSGDRDDMDSGFARGLLDATEIPRRDMDENPHSRIMSVERIKTIISEPGHYLDGANGYEPMVVLEHWSRGENALGWMALSAMKYLIRYKRKGTPLEDLYKAREYVNRLIELTEAELKDE